MGSDQLLARVVVVDAGPLLVERLRLDRQRKAAVVRKLGFPVHDREARVFLPQEQFDALRSSIDQLPGPLELASKAAIVAGLASDAGCSTIEIHLADREYHEARPKLPTRHDRIEVTTDAGVRRGLVMYTPDDAGGVERLEVITGQIPASQPTVDKLVDTVAQTCTEGTNVVVSGWAASPRPSHLFRALRDVTRRRRARMLMDTRSLSSASWCMPDVLKVTSDEASMIFGEPLTTAKQIISLLSRYKLPFLGITCGAQGAYLRLDERMYHMHRPARAVNAVGAGDSAMSVIAAHFGTDMPTIEVARRAIFAASRNTETHREGGIAPDHQWLDEVAVTPIPP